MPAASEDYDVFFCYSWRDKPAADALVNRLRGETLDGRPLRIFQDDRELDDFDMITPEVNSALRSSRCLVVLYSENLPRSAYCRFEIRVALSCAHRLDGTPQRVMAIPRNLPYERIRPGRLTAPRLPDPLLASEDELVASVLARVARTDERTFGQAPETAEPRWSPAPLVGNPRFVGRDLELWEVYDALHEHEDPGVGGAPVARIVGLGGMGKTMLAEQYAREFASDYPGGVFVLRGFGSHLADRADRGRVRESRARQVRDILRHDGTDLTGMDTARIEQVLRERLSDQRYLWIVDDLPAGLDHVAFAELIAPTRLGHTLVTTRYTPREHGYPWGGQVVLGALDERAAVDLLTRNGQPENRQEERAVRELAGLLGGHPLALAVASGLAPLPGTGGFTGLLETTVRFPGPDVLELGERLWDEFDEEHRPGIAATMLRSLDHLGAHGSLATRIMSLLAPAPVPQALVEGAARRDRSRGSGSAENAVAGLREAAALSLVNELPRENGASLWSAHSMVSRTVRFADSDRPGREGLRRAAVTELGTLLEGSRTTVAHRSLVDFLPHVHEVALGLEGDAEWHLMDRAGRVHAELGDFRKGLDTYRTLHEKLGSVSGADDETLLRVEAGLGLVWGLWGDHERAAHHKERAHQGLLALRGENDPAVITAANNLGVTYNDLGDHPRARKAFARVYRARRRLLRGHHPDTLQALANYAIATAAVGEHRLALRLKRAVLARSRHLFGDEHTLTLDTRNSVAASLNRLGETEQAHRELAELHEDLRRLLGPHNLDTLVVRESMAVIGPSREDSRVELEHVYTGLRGSVPPAHPIAARVLRRLLEFSLDRGTSARARERSGAVVERRGPVTDPEAVVALTVMLAIDLQELRVREHGPDSPQALTATCLLAHGIALQGPGQGALPLVVDAHRGLVQEWGSAAPWTLAASWVREWVEDSEGEARPAPE